ncbi:hypothetical protein [Marinomonas mediterranea]|uniref:Bacterial transcription activator effector binding domain-containing protein n=1 Tax=Marinomonas mediterranea (strain ATCC 700492 / JCM 21426 / NBRC 103028 / MMB-1) TaxID=717774 RepID=F2K4Y1_MARM1|nr:hypothetical protein [Marinomonas mediterranea]ADZ92624.1 hypothetical protein Marme_3408 [Marinomonas mediterranea MMB-1]WCN10565.1 hypothetical protein GV055_17360 [Marinomonas mediterranea]WCN14614.1 hypothetical protein GV054_17185 [Marinomonas mediterranea]WCN18661.1 hypothetical protein GV053_17250 [Marinomonas mediterranea MMB-1]
MVVLGLVVGSILIALVYWLITHGHFQFQRHQYIEADSNEVYKEIANLATWPSWCVWRSYDPDADIQLDYFDSQSISASSLIIESNKIAPTSVQRQSEDEVEQVATFLIDSPSLYWQSFTIYAHLTQRSHNTLITFDVEGKIPFFRRHLLQKHLSHITLDIELSLISLKNRMERKIQHRSSITFELEGCQRLDTLDAVIRPFEATEQSISQVMEIGFHELFVALGPENPPTGGCFAIYTKADLSTHSFTGKLGVPVQRLTDCNLHPECIRFSSHYLQLRYHGPYKHLYLAWRVLNVQATINGYRYNRSKPALELYEVGPKDADDEDMFVTILSLPIKS